ncbi:hypothetical protein A2U01_0082230, partial [Trifolium medium]|nr:hypothetical protein [Trifolium medium]
MKNDADNLCSGICAPRRGTGTLRRSDGKQHISWLEDARRAGRLGAAHKRRISKSVSTT